jgi:CHAT domain-containing protein
LGTQAPRFRYDDALRLYQELLAPQASHMAGAQQLIIAASGDLGQIPYAVLVNDPWPQGADKDAPWLIKSHAISQISSAQSWLALRKMPKTVSGQASMIAWGDPSFTLSPASVAAQKAGVRSAVTTRAVRSADLSQPHVDPVTYATLPPLPETRDEVLALARLMKSNAATDVLLGDKATRLSVLESSDSGQLKSKKLVVFATHGLLAGDLPGLSEPALAMASSGSRDESPLLTLQDVLGLRMNADWVILSACNTAGADGKNEEALSGLARGFFYAGAKSLLVTHWSVESESAMMLTTETFKVYGAESQVTRAQSLQRGMLKVMQDARYGHPAYWAPYALVGEGGR